MLVKSMAELSNYNIYQTRLFNMSSEKSNKMFALNLQNSSRVSFKGNPENELAQKEHALEARAQKLAQAEEELKKKDEVLDNLIQNYLTLLEEDVAYERSGFRALYGIKIADLPDKMGFGEQITYVISTLVENKNKLSNPNEDTPENITKALLDNDGKLSNESLRFLSRVLSVSENKCSEEILIDAIEAVKGNKGQIDMGKAAMVVSLLAFGQSSLSAVIKKVKACNVKV